MSLIENAPVPRKPWIAAALSAVSTGLGHIYCGRIVMGIVLLCIGWLLVPLALFAALLPPFTVVLILLMAGVICLLGMYVFAIVDAWRKAARGGDGYQLRDYNRGIVYAMLAIVGVCYPFCIGWCVRANAFEAFKIPTASMSPGVLPGDRIMANKLIYQHQPPRRGDLIVFRAPTNRDLMYIKRVVALAGDTVALKNNRVIVNGRDASADSDAASESIDGSTYKIAAEGGDSKPDFPETVVPKGTCFVVGDARGRSHDSREFGPVPFGDVIGQAQYIYWPAGSWGRFGAIRNAN